MEAEKRARITAEARAREDERRSLELPFARYYRDPVAFAEEVLKLRLWSRQREILEAVVKGSPLGREACDDGTPANDNYARVAVRSGHKIGKTTTAAIIALWFFATRGRAYVIVTANSHDQVKASFWKELRRLYDLVDGDLVFGSTCAIDPKTGLRHIDGRRIIGVSPEKPETMAGFSSPDLLFIVDEASGADPAIFEAIQGNLAGGAGLVMFGNPTQANGVFFDAFHTKREFWRCVHVSSEETPNVTGVGDRIDGLATRAYIEEKKREWGVDSPTYQVRITGNFAGQASNAVIGLSMIETARKLWPITRSNDGAELHLGVDVARFGDDDSVIAARRGKRARVAAVVHGMDGVQVAGKILEVARELRDGGEPVTVKIDCTGGYGAGPFDILKAMNLDWLTLVDVNVSRVADDDEDYALLRDQLWFGVGRWLKEGGVFEPDPRLESELLAATYSFDSRGRRRVASKDDMKKLLDGRSPDRADALALAVYAAKKKHLKFFGATTSGRNAA
jgi:phage terminase large subunit